MRKTLGVLLLLSIASPPLLAEVMDKEPSRPQLFAVAVIGGAIGFFATRFKPFLVLLTLPLSAALPFSVVLETYDRYVGPLIRSEAGTSYVVEAHVALAIVLAANIAGAVAGVRRSRKRRGQDDHGSDSTHPHADVPFVERR